MIHVPVLLLSDIMYLNTTHVIYSDSAISINVHEGREYSQVVGLWWDSGPWGGGGGGALRY